MIPPLRSFPDVEALAAELDAASHAARVRWIRGLSRAEQLRLFSMAEGRPVRPDDLVDGEGVLVRHVGRNGLPWFNRFEKRFARLGDLVVGYNHNPWPASAVSGPGHFSAYVAPDHPDEVWIDYRRVPTVRHPDFPPLRSNERGLAALVFGNLVDVLRRVSDHVTIGDSFKDMPRDVGATPPGVEVPAPVMPFLVRLGAWLPTAPFVLCRAP